MTDFSDMTVAQAADAIAAGTASSEDVTGACLARIAQTEEAVGAFAFIDADHALAQARDSDAWRRSGRPIGPLHGVPVAVKDLIDTADYPTEYGSRYFAGRRPRTDATVVSRLRAAGAVIMGKSVTTEMAYFSPGKTRNPRDLTRTPGGSSSGSAAAVAAGMVPLSIGSQTNGSMIRPAAFCGVYGMKPSHGLISRAGSLQLSAKLDHVGIFARSLDDIALMLDTLAGYDPADPDTRPYASPAFGVTASEPPPLPPSIAFMRTPVWDRADAEAKTAIEELAREIGANEIDLPDAFAEAWEAQRVIMASEMAHNLGHHVDSGREVSQAFRELIEFGRSVTATQYLAAMRDAQSYTESVNELFEQYADAVLTLSARGVAPQGLEATGDPAFCSLWSLTGLPTINLPVLANDDGLPIGVQLIGATGRDDRLLRTGNALLDQLQ